MQGEVRLTLMEKNFVNGKLFFIFIFYFAPSALCLNPGFYTVQCF